MRMNTILMCTAALLLSHALARAGHVWEDPNGWWDSHFTSDPTTPRFTAGELSLDLAGSYIAAEEKFTHLFQTSIRDGHWGGEAGLNYFFLREIGIGADVNMSDNGGKLVDEVLGSLILRLPIGSSGFAPYIFGGGGRGVEPAWQWLYDGGVGAEYRFNPVTGLFIDGRYIWAEKTSDALLLRAGLRLTF